MNRTPDVDHDTFDRQMVEQERIARDHALALRQLELELGIFRPPPQIIDEEE